MSRRTWIGREVTIPIIPPTDEQLTAKRLPLRFRSIDKYRDEDGTVHPHEHDDAAAWPTLLDLCHLAAQHGIPLDAARVEYQGCGTHELDLVWS